MAVMSMTGFARVDGADDGASWFWELRSVNGRGLDVRLRVHSAVPLIPNGSTFCYLTFTYFCVGTRSAPWNTCNINVYTRYTIE